MDMDPCFINPAADDYHLQSTRWQWQDSTETWVPGTNTSPCIDSGSPGHSPNYEFGASNIRINMGAYGASSKAAITPDFWAILSDMNNDGIADYTDFALFATDWLEVANFFHGDFNRDYQISSLDISNFASDWLQTTSWHYAEKTDLNADRFIDFRDFALLTQTQPLTSSQLADLCRCLLYTSDAADE